MVKLTRRGLMVAAGASALPRFAIAAADQRPDITVAVQLLATSNTIDPLVEQSNVGTRITNSFLETLIGKNYQGQLESIPRTATAWKRIDERTLEVSLRQGVKFHNGDEMTAEDVAFSYSRARMFGTTEPAGMDKTIALDTHNPMAASKTLPAQVPPVARRLWPSLDKIEIVDKYTVRFVNAAPDLTLEGRLTGLGSEIVNRRGFEEAASWLDYARKPIGTGPYKVREYKPDVALVLEAHDEYWGGRPPLRSLTFRQVPEVAQRVNGLRSGEFQFASDLPPDQIKTVEDDARLHVVGGLVPNHRITAFDKFDTALRDPRLRLAMAHAIDRQAIVDSLWLGRTRVPPGLQFEFYDYMFVKSWTVPEYDLARARELVKQSGYKGDPIPYRLLNDYYTNQTANGQVLTEMWQKAGINVQIEMKENWTQVFDRAGQRGVHDWSNSAVFNDPVSSLVSQHGPQGQQQQTGEYGNAEVNELSVALTTSTDKDKRHQIFARLLEICEREDPAYTVLHQNATFTGKLKSVQWKAAPDFGMDFRSANWGGSLRG
ncbi:peptide/nickel transport system substrate-binding protein [Rhizobiales bacterium GAS191]|nr:peptide/nickel transport system substrate-binding protein [Rhizobiales bacterium GAS113]SEB96839.1 peptide/nickel transport system substrate-binding protein [Rhizobiales bacterium GAS191]